MLTENRVTRAIDAAREKAATLAPERQAELNDTLALEALEHHAYQNAQARAHASGILTTDEAQIVYAALGEVGSAENGGWAAGTDLPTKVVVTQLVGELMGLRS